MQDSSQSYLSLLETAKTKFKFRGHDFTVAFAPATAFDLWARQFYNNIINVDPTVWGTHDRWMLINELLKKELLFLVRNEGEGSARLVYKDSAEVPGQGQLAGTYTGGSSGLSAEVPGELADTSAELPIRANLGFQQGDQPGGSSGV